MMHHSAARLSASLGTAVVVAALVACGEDDTQNLVVTPIPNVGFNQTNLVADVSALGARTIDPNLVNPWGLAFGATGALWTANNGTGTSTSYSQDGAKLLAPVAIPSAVAGEPGVPTGMIFSASPDFVIPGTGTGPALGAATFIFAGEDGTISAWNAAAGSSAVLVADRSADGAVYKGIAMAQNGSGTFLYLTNFKGNSVDVFDAGFHFVRSFTDASNPAGFAPFGIQRVNGNLYVTYAKQHGPDNEDDEAGAGNGFVDVFQPDGTRLRRFASNGALNSPWGIAVAPSGFGGLAGDILIGNFGDGTIGAYDPNSGVLVGVLRTGSGTPIVIPGLWALEFAPGTTALYFTSGPSDESHGLVGTLTAR
jgi:uncharacterized protein (TIGR03118 family)